MCAVPRGTVGARASPRLELADIVRAHGDAYRRTHRLATVQHRALRAIAACRTAILGGHRETCDRCGATRITYNSCRNRHCPKCQTVAKERRLAARRADLLPIPVLPRRLHAPAHPQRPRPGQSAGDLHAPLPRGRRYTPHLRAGSAPSRRDDRHYRDAAHVGADASQHLHVHCLVTGGALAADGSRWITGRSSFLFPRPGLGDGLSREISRRLVPCL